MAKFVRQSVPSDLKQYGNIKSGLEDVSSQLAEKAKLTDLDVYNISYLGASPTNGFDNSTIINNALINRKNIYIPEGDFEIAGTVNMPNGTKIKMHNNARLVIKSNIDGLIVNNNCEINGGSVYVNFSPYTKVAVKFNGVSRIDKGIISNFTVSAQSQVGTGLLLESVTSTSFVSFVRFSNVRITNFTNGVHLKSSGGGFSNANMFVNSSIEGCLNMLKLEGTGGSSLAGNQFQNIQIQPYNQTTNTICETIQALNNYIHMYIWDYTGMVIFKSDTISASNTFISNVPYTKFTGVFDDKGKNNIENSFKYLNRGHDARGILPSTQDYSSFSGTQDNWLLNADKKFYITAVGKTTGNSYLSGVSNAFHVATGRKWEYTYNNEDVELIIDLTKKPDGSVFVDTGLYAEESYPGLIQNLGIQFGYGNGSKKVVIEYSTDGTTWSEAYNTAYQPIDVNCFNSNVYFSNMKKLRVTLGSPFDGKTLISVANIFALSTSAVGQAWMPKIGGTLHGTLSMGSNYFVVGNKTSLPTASASFRGYIASVQGNGTTTADTLYICLMSATGTYSWKTVTNG